MSDVVSTDLPDIPGVPGATVETELKLALEPEALRRLRSHPLFGRGAPPVTSRLYTVYFDTPRLDLWRHGVALRLRRSGGRWMQTIKGGGTARGGLHARFELENAVPGPRPDCTVAGRDHPLGKLLSSKRLHTRLKPVFATEFTRSMRVLDLDAGASVQVCVDRGRIKCGNRTEPICELELELKSGAASSLYDLALKLLDEFPLRLENRSKAERGYALCRGAPPQPVRARAAALAPDMAVKEAFTAILWTILDQLQANERGAAGTRNPEFLHQLRVSLRRLRSALGLFSDVVAAAEVAPFESEFRWLARILGAARDWDVFMTETLPPIRRAHGDDAGLSLLARRCTRARTAARRRVREALDSPRYRSLMLRFCAWLAAEPWLRRARTGAHSALDAPIPQFAAAILDRRYARVRRRGRKLRRLAAAELHRLRIAIKKLRYAVAFFAALYDARHVNDMLVRTARLQDILGALNDAAAVSRLIGEVDGSGRGDVPIDARGIVLGWTLHRAEKLRPRLQAAWKRFRNARKFW